MSEPFILLILVSGLLCTQALWQAQVDGLADMAHIIVTVEHTRHTGWIAWRYWILPPMPMERGGPSCAGI
jgi:hypothetical protein